MTRSTLEEKLRQLQLMSGPDTLAEWTTRDPAQRELVRAALEALVDRELARRAERLVATRLQAAKFVQVQTVEQLGPQARQYLTLIRAGTRSLRAELEHLLLLTTLYGPAPVEAALGALLAQSIVGSHHVEQWLRLQTAGPVAPPPLTLGDPRLVVPVPRPNLQRYDALLGERAPGSGEESPDDAFNA